MKSTLKIFFVFASISFAVSCSKNDDPQPAENNTNTTPQTPTLTLNSAIISGDGYNNRKLTFSTNNNTALVEYAQDHTGIALTTKSDSLEYEINIFFDGNKAQTKTFSSRDKASMTLKRKPSNTTTKYESIVGQGKIVITKFDNAGKMVAGSFDGSFTKTGSASTKVNIKCQFEAVIPF